MSSGPRWVPPPGTGLPDHWLNLSVRAVPNHPGRPGGCPRPLLRLRFTASSPLGAWPPAIWRFEAESGSLALRLAPSPRGVPGRGITPIDRPTGYVSNGPLHGCLLSCSKVGQVHWRYQRTPRIAGDISGSVGKIVSPPVLPERQILRWPWRPWRSWREKSGPMILLVWVPGTERRITV